MKLTERIQQLERDNFDMTDSDEHRKWEKHKRTNRKRKIKYEKRCKTNPSKFHLFQDKVIIDICLFIGGIKDIMYFLSCSKFLSRFKPEQIIWQKCFENTSFDLFPMYNQYISQYMKFNPALKTPCTYKGMLYELNSRLKSI